MASKPETSFIQGVHRHLPTVYKEKMNNPYRGGTPDVWYSGKLADLWVEYKCIPRIPKQANILPDLSPNQQLWLSQRYSDGRDVVVVVGVVRGGGVIFEHMSWMQPLSPAEFTKQMRSKEAIAAFIHGHVGDTTACLSIVPLIKPPKSPRRSTSS